MRSISGTITLKSGETIAVTDEILVANSLRIKMSTCQSKFDVGSFNAAIMTIGILDEQSLNHDFGGAVINLTVTIDDTSTALGIYYVSGEQVKRLKNKVTLTAQDKTSFFDKELPSEEREKEYTAVSALTAACTACGVSCGAILSEFPNRDVKVSLASEAIQTWRDVVMWCAQTMACNAIIDRNGALTLRRARYAQTTEMITYDRRITADERVSIHFGDSRVCMNTLNSYSAGQVKTYKRSVEYIDPLVVLGSINLPDNPLLYGKSEEDCDTVNKEWVKYMATFAPHYVTVKMFNGVDLWLGEAVEWAGGDIDINRRIIGVITAINWQYSGLTTVTCTAPQEGDG